MRPAIALASLLAAFLVACLDPLEPDVGPPLTPSCLDDDNDSDVEVSFEEDIRSRIFAARCFRCHSPDGADPIGIDVGGLDLTSYATLREGGAVSETEIVVPGRPCKSVLAQKVGEYPPFGARMPLGGPPFLAEAEKQLIHDWIAEGARDN